MGKIVSNFFISLDGVVESPDQWHFPYFNDEMGQIIGSGMATTGAFLMGRKLYDEWSEYWPPNDGDEEFGSFINSIPKYVVSDSLTEPTWNNTTVLPGDQAAEAAPAQGRDGRRHHDVRQRQRSAGCSPRGCSTSCGCWSTRSRSATASGSFDGTPTQPLRLVDSGTLSSGVLNLTYAPTRTPPTA